MNEQKTITWLSRLLCKMFRHCYVETNRRIGHDLDTVTYTCKRCKNTYDGV